ncbi:hypothetical protein BDP27DRAFT_577831 [Rhodocollybia butyracea]|uniref:DUF6533 domain-containing protein n=1 Tax=Rhodocollybia butyracea TaxID=206335 RepID=A0A9P5P475_9AGAR|nr:hypothetical protein BDP27DRAFT_577831 [Rhodocollybia butyracea]
MNDDSPDSRSTAHQLLLHGYFQMLAISILYWDHLLTFKYEVHYLWQGPKTHSTYLFFLNRYFACFANIAVTVLSFATLPTQVSAAGSNTFNDPATQIQILQSCKSYSLFRQLVLFAQQIIVCGTKSPLKLS